MVFDEPPAPAARAELGLATCEAVALRLVFETRRVIEVEVEVEVV